MSNDIVPEIFTDGISDIGFGGGVLRLDLYSLSPSEKDESGQPARQLRQRLVMSPQGFLDSLAAMQGMLQKLEQAGVLRRQSDAAQGGEAPRSPNV